MAKPTVNKHGRKIRHSKRDPADRLLQEIGRYISANGGSALVAGPIRFVEWPEDAERNATSGAPEHMRFFAIDVKVMGMKPLWPSEVRTSFGAGESTKGSPKKRGSPITPAPEDPQC